MLALCILLISGVTRSFAERVLRIQGWERKSATSRIAACAAISIALITASMFGQGIISRQRQLAEDLVLQRLEQETMAKKADGTVQKLTSEAQALFHRKNYKLAQAKVDEALGIAHATNKAEAEALLGKLADLRVQEAVNAARSAWKIGLGDSVVESRLAVAKEIHHRTTDEPILALLREIDNSRLEQAIERAETALRDNDLTTAKSAIHKALALEHAEDLRKPESMAHFISLAEDADVLREMLVGLDDANYERLRNKTSMPKGTVSGYACIDAMIQSAARKLLPEVTQERDRIKAEALAAKRETQRKAALAREAELAALELARHKEQQAESARKLREEQLEREAIPLVLEGWTWSKEGMFVLASGEVTNRSTKVLRYVEVVVSFCTAAGEFITSGTGITEFDPILPGQSTPFKVYVQYNPAMESAKLAFKEMSGEAIPCVRREDL